MYSANIISDVRSCGDGLQKISKSNKRRIFGQSWQGRWIFLLNLEVEQSLFHAKLKYHRSYVLSEPYHCKEKKNYMFFKVSTITDIVKFVESIDRTLKSQKTISLAIFSSKKQFNSTDISCWDKNIKCCRLNLFNLKKSKSYFYLESVLDKAVQFNRSFVLWQMLLKLIC